MLRFLSVGMFAVRKLSEFYGPIAPQRARFAFAFLFLIYYRSACCYYCSPFVAPPPPYAIMPTLAPFLCRFRFISVAVLFRSEASIFIRPDDWKY